MIQPPPDVAGISEPQRIDFAKLRLAGGVRVTPGLMLPADGSGTAIESRLGQPLGTIDQIEAQHVGIGRQCGLVLSFAPGLEAPPVAFVTADRYFQRANGYETPPSAGGVQFRAKTPCQNRPGQARGHWPIPQYPQNFRRDLVASGYSNP
jgi:hypothetical protein